MKALTRHIFLTVAGTALVLRGLFALFYVSSPFSFFHCVPGLDMETLLRFGEWGRPGNSFFFTVHRLQVFLFHYLNNGTHPVLWHTTWQSLLGIAGAVMLADIALKLSGKKLFALTAGILWALNPVELMYEFTTLQDSLVNFGIILSVWSFLVARKHHFSPLYALGAGGAVGVAATGRPVAIGLVILLSVWSFQYLYRRKLPLKRIFSFTAGIIAVWLCFSAVNFWKGGPFNCFFNPVPYAVSVNRVQESCTPDLPQQSNARFIPILKTSLKMASRIPQVWSPTEIPENLNIYFLRTKIPFFKLPFEFIPLCAAAGLLLMLPTGTWKKKAGFILLPIAALVFFICIREPIGRYRLLLLPWFVLLTVWLISFCNTRSKALVIFSVLGGIIVSRCVLYAPPLRAADYAAWGWALEKEAKQLTPEVIKHFQLAYLLKPESNNAIALITRAMRTDNRDLAEKTARHWISVSNNSALSCYYGALAAFPDHIRMKEFLSLVKVQDLPRRLRFRYYIMSGDVQIKHNAPQEALRSYKSALQLQEGTPALRSCTLKKIKQLEDKK